MTKHIKNQTKAGAWSIAEYLLGELKFESWDGYRTYRGANGWFNILSPERYEVNLNNGETVVLWITEG